MVLLYELLFIFPIRIFRMFQVPQRPAAKHYRNLSKVVIWRRRRRMPLQRPRIPRIIACGRALEVTPDQIEDQEQDAKNLENHANRDDEVPNLPATARVVGVNPSRHTHQAGNMHEVECQMESDDEQPEVPLS